MRNAMQGLADTLPNAEHRILEGQTHMVKAEILAPVLSDFLGSDSAQSETAPGGGKEPTTAGEEPCAA